ncbi:MAG TPA: CaiB/BaiF CoA-transferase family protein [Alphaproteobacteria bacterium]|nr:CaiB/BaiF CoA-transferase family protein [Alphaproteobacteria bacterium]
MKPLTGTLVVSLDQAVAAPITARRLADAGARVIKLERPEGDFARYYDDIVKGQCTHYVWLNRGKESVVADLTKAEDRRLFEALLAKADVLVQNLKPGALAKLGFAIETLRKKHPRLVCCSISGYGDEGPYRDRKAYDLLVQAESGLASVTGGAEAPARVGVSVVDIATGMHAYEAILEALLARARTGTGADIRVSMFDAMMEWMAIPMLYTEYGSPPKRLGLTHPTVGPYGVFETADKLPILISIQNDREWVAFCRKVLGQPEYATDPRFATNLARVANRPETDTLVARCFAGRDVATLSRQLEEAHIAFARVNDVASILRHPHLRRVTVASPNGPVALPAPPAQFVGEESAEFGPLPALGEHTERVRREFLG